MISNDILYSDILLPYHLKISGDIFYSRYSSDITTVVMLCELWTMNANRSPLSVCSRLEAVCNKGEPSYQTLAYSLD